MKCPRRGGGAGLCGVSAVVFLAAPMAAQTFVVDAANGPGTHFTELPAAVATVPDGAVLLVRPGSYAGFTLDGKGLAILADPGVTMTGQVRVQNTSAQQPVTLRGLDWPSIVTPTPAPETLLAVQFCSGRVVLDGVRVRRFVCRPNPLVPSQCQPLAGVHLTSCARVALRDCDIRYLRVFLADVVIESSVVWGSMGMPATSFLSYPPSPGIACLGTLQINGATTITGGPANTFFPPLAGAPAIQGGGDVRLLDGVVDATAAGAGVWIVPAIDLGSGTVRQDSRCTILASAGSPLVQAGSHVVGPMPAVTSSGGAIGGAMSAAAASQAGDLVVLLLGLPGPRVTVAPFADPFWLHPQQFVFHAFGVQVGSAPLSSSLVVPADPVLRGLVVVWQAVADGPVTGLQASNPSLVVIR